MTTEDFDTGWFIFSLPLLALDDENNKMTDGQHHPLINSALQKMSAMFSIYFHEPVVQVT